MKIAFIGDSPGRVHYNRFLSFRKNIHKHSFDFYSANTAKINRICRSYDAVYYASFMLFFRHPVDHKHVFGSATSWKCVFDSSSRRQARSIINKFFKLSANNIMLCNELKKIRGDILYLPNGVDDQLFCPPLDYVFNANNLNIGWAGNHDRKEKNYRSILLPLRDKCRSICDFKIIATSKSDSSSSLRPHKRMRRFYQRLNFYLVTSSYEGTPNPALEAAACGVPLITTKVGNMTEIVVDGVNGFFVKCDVNSMAAKIKSLRSMSGEDYGNMRKKIRQTIESDWTWEKSCARFSDFFRI